MVNKLKKSIVYFLYDHCLAYMINRRWKSRYGHKIDWRNPRNINEKMWWLACHGDTSMWHICADKYRVRQFVKDRGLEHLLIKLYGVWDNANDINYDALPDKFILKCNHDSGTSVVVDKALPFNKDEINTKLNIALSYKFGYSTGETFYNKIKPLIIAEEFLVDNVNTFSSSLVDYKVWCFNGKPYCTWACHSRTKGCTYVNIYDMNWNVHPELTIPTDHYRDGKGVVPKPKTFDEMMEAASVLSKGFPEVRVDFYEVNGKLYFGEMTFMTCFAEINHYTPEFLVELGEQCVLPL